MIFLTIKIKKMTTPVKIRKNTSLRCKRKLFPKKITDYFNVIKEKKLEDLVKEKLSHKKCNTENCENFLTKEEVESKIDTCIFCHGLVRCHNWPRCDFFWDGNAQHFCLLDD